MNRKARRTVAGQVDEIEEKRRHSRFSDEIDEVQLLVTAKVADESRSGIGLILEAGWELREGTRIEVMYSGAPMSGVVRNQVPLPDGSSRVGVEWVC